jgi:hypothetical protein
LLGCAGVQMVERVFKDHDEPGEGTVTAEDLHAIFSVLQTGAAPDSASVNDLAHELYSQATGGWGKGPASKCVPYDELKAALTLAEAQFKARYPAPATHKPKGALLYEKLLEKKKNVVVGKKTPGEEPEAAQAKPGEGNMEDAFMAACLKIDRRKTGFIR